MRPPVRNEVRTSSSRQTGPQHLGLAFSKYASPWRDEPPWSFGSDGRRKFLEEVIRWNGELRKRGSEGARLLEAARCRVDRLVDALARDGHAVWRRTFRTSWRLVSGLGISHPLETGFVFHHTWGVPYVPGSGVKGAASGWARERVRELPAEPAEARRQALGQLRAVFGQPLERGHVPEGGRVIFFDALPTSWPEIDIDIMNPHYARYYQGKDPPADWLDPVPIQFLAIAPGQPFELVVAVKPEPDAPASRQQQLLAFASEAVIGAATEGGLGGKSAVGYGYFA